MKDIELIDIVFDYLYANNSCQDISKAILEKTGKQLSNDECFHIFKLIESTDFVDELSWSCGPHRAIKLNDSGYQMMLQQGSYSAFIESGKQEKEKVTEEKTIERKNLILDIQSKEWSLKTKWIVLLGIIAGILGWVVALLQFIFYK